MALDMKKLFGGGMEGPDSVSVKIGSKSEPDERVLSAKAIIKAVKSGDAEALDVALEDHYRACEESKEDDEGSDPSDESDGHGSKSDSDY